MTDLVQRLRGRKTATSWRRGIDTDYATTWEPDELCREAADEIERLRAAEEALLRQALDFIVATNRSSQFWLVPASNLNKIVNALRERLGGHHG